MLEFGFHGGSQYCRMILNDGINFGVSGEVIGVVEVVDKEAVQLIEGHCEVEAKGYLREVSQILLFGESFVLFA
jgi:hypothetical protein